MVANTAGTRQEPYVCNDLTRQLALEPKHEDKNCKQVPRKANLRQLDLSLLSELWALSEAMAAWRRQLERAPRLRPAPPPPPPPHYLRT
ncbi:hypothetical protein EVAR_147_1 [Eumeta japonica]|uniref:Uncharacterized protein n=1 Tax=Eumeta variegata TaxID=151549 RepID=A0A4C1SBX5_EUMVA|nr:hypothetical protein EVAR_147_1 [Eumeta japonica]